MEFQLRSWRREDAEDVAFFADNERIAQNLRDVFPHPYTLADARGYVDSCVEGDETRQLCRAIECGGRAVGSIGLFRGEDVYRKSAELGYWLGRAFWGRGVMTRAARLICSEGFRTWDVARIYAEPYAVNTGSRRVLEKAGFTLEGTLRNSVFKNGRLMDSCIYGLLREEAKA